MTGKEIEAQYRPYANRQEANRNIQNKKIIKRPGVFNDDKKEKYTIIGTTDETVAFENWKGERTTYYYSNIIFDYLFENGEVIGIKR